jgi:PknH-like extracellular domain
MRQLVAAVAVAAAGMLGAACGSGNQSGTASSSTTTTTPSKPPLAQAALANLLLTPAEIDSALGVTGSRSVRPIDQLNNDNPADIFPKSYKFPEECLYIMGAAQTSDYVGSGNTAVHGERDSAPLPEGADGPDPDVSQVVVLFPSAKEANAFFTATSQRWPACANRQDTSPAEGDSPELVWKAGPVSNANGVLSSTASLSVSKNGTAVSQNCQRALTVRNNVVIDVEACRKDPSGVALNVANQIAGKVDKQ